MCVCMCGLLMNLNETNPDCFIDMNISNIERKRVKEKIPAEYYYSIDTKKKYYIVHILELRC